MNILNISSGLNISLGSEKVIKSVPAKEIKADNIEITQIVDMYSAKKVVAHTKSVLGQIVLWEGEAYDAIGQWTDQDVKNRILEIIG